MKKMKLKRNKSRIRLWGAPELGMFKSTQAGKILQDCSKIHFDRPADQDRLIAIEKLAVDIFNDPSAARAFSVNPDEYLMRSGFKNVKLDLNSIEVRVAMAMGDPDVKKAARNCNIENFIDAISRQGIRLSTDNGEEMTVAAFEIAVAISAVLTSYAAVAYTVETAVQAHHALALVQKIAVSGERVSVLQKYQDILIRIAEHVGSKRFSEQIKSTSVKTMLNKYVRLNSKFQYQGRSNIRKKRNKKR
ncbi:MAG: hypothetical protein V1869_00320 [Candidatus Omnitrophota bacterium]